LSRIPGHRLNLPDTASKPFLVAAALIWAGAVMGRVFGHRGLIAAAVLALAALALPQRKVIAVALVAGALSGWLSGARDEAILTARLPETSANTRGVAMTDTAPGRFGDQVVVRLLDGTHRGVPVVLRGELPEIAAGQKIQWRGEISGPGFRIQGDPVAGTIRVSKVALLGEARLPFAVANKLRELIIDQIDPAGSPARALLSGFLIGDIRHLPPADTDALRRAGLTHFVAVSGSNVALFLGLWWILLAPLGMNTLARAVTGIGGLGLFVLLTRWEPSVVRASAMAAVLLTARAVGLSLSAWSALGLGVAGCLLISGELSGDVGFQLSVAATCGVMLGGSMLKFRPRWLSSVLGATIAAQLAVAPLLLSTFGSVPLAAPLANLLAAPLVTFATAAGGIGAIARMPGLVVIAEVLADGVLWIGRRIAPMPQAGALEMVLIGGGLALLASRRFRWLVAAVAVVFVAIQRNDLPQRPSIVFFDVGQGDSALLLGESLTVLIDGGPDPATLAAKLADYRVDRLDLIIASHVHADHLEGFDGILGSVEVGAIWQAFGSHETGASVDFLSRAERGGVPVYEARVGDVIEVEGARLEVLGPRRRYSSPNDESLVVVVTIRGIEILLAGDIETFAQAEIGAVEADILKVPHQGAATSDAGWLEENAGRIAVISVGPNNFGHPADWVVDVLTGSGATVMRTDRDGDVIVELGQGRAALSSSRK